MSTESNPTSNDFSERLPAELESLSSLLDAVGAADRKVADDELEHRVFGASLGSLLEVQATEQIAAEAGASARAAAGDGLEGRVHQASVSELASDPPIAGRIRHGAETRRGAVWTRRLALAACLGLVGVAGIWMLRGNHTAHVGGTQLATASHSMSTEELKASLSKDFDVLLSAAGEASTSETAENDTGFKSEWLDELVEEGKAS